MKLLFGRTSVVWFTPCNQYFSSNFKCDYWSVSSSEVVKSESSLSVSSIMVLKVANSFLNLNLIFEKIYYTCCIASLGGFTWFNQLVFVFDTFGTVSIWFFCAMFCWVIFLYLSDTLHIFPIFISYGGDCLLISPHLWGNTVPFEVVCCITLDLMHLSRIVRFTFLFLVHWQSPVIK